jgi:hypothetical protein
MAIDKHCSDGEGVAFLVGAGRSGTTLLYKLLCLHSQIAFISNYDNRIPWLSIAALSSYVASRTDLKLTAWFNRGGNAYFTKRPFLKKLLPTPVEGESVYAMCGVPLYPSQDAFLEVGSIDCLTKRFDKIRRSSGGGILLSKRTANNRRISLLHGAFPQARYIHLIRDGREVASSLSHVEWWDSHTLWWDGRTPRQLEESGLERLTICARNWVREMEVLSVGLKTVDSSRILEVRYDKLLSNPMLELERMLDFLDLSANEEFRSAIDSLGLFYKPGSWSSRWTDTQISSVLQEEKSLLTALGYVQDVALKTE